MPLENRIVYFKSFNSVLVVNSSFSTVQRAGFGASLCYKWFQVIPYGLTPVELGLAFWGFHELVLLS